MLTSLRVGGAERQAVALAERMAARGHTVEIVVLLARGGDECRTTVAVTCLNLRKTLGGALAALAGARRFLRRFQPDILHSHMFHANILARCAGWLAAVPCTISTVHNVYEGGRLRMLAYRLTDGLSRTTGLVSQSAAERYVRLRAVPARKCRTMTNGIDIALFAPDLERRHKTRASFHAGDNFLWLAAGRIVPAKDFANLLRAFVAVCASRPEARLWIAGEPWGDEIVRLKRLCAETGIENRVDWLGLRRDMPALLDAADGFVLSSAWEGLPLALAEAMAMEKPVVATDVGGVRELAAGAGEIVPPRQADALSAAMLRIMEMPSGQRQALGCAARQRVQREFNIDRKLEEWESLYRDTISWSVSA